MNIYKLPLLFLASAFCLLLNSCVPAKKLYYFNDLTPSTFTKVDSMKLASQPKIQKGDRLSITVSSRDNSITEFLNPFSGRNTGNGTGGGFLVNSSGIIDFPLIGEITVAGLSTEEVAVMMKKKLTFFYKDPYIYVDLQGRVYLISGSGSTTIPIVNQRLTIFEAVAQSAPAAPYDIKDKVWLIREENGNRIYAQLDLNSKDIFTSPYYYLHNNDLIYRKPGRFSSFFGPGSPEKSVFTLASTILGILIALRIFR